MYVCMYVYRLNCKDTDIFEYNTKYSPIKINDSAYLRNAMFSYKLNRPNNSLL